METKGASYLELVDLLQSRGASIRVHPSVAPHPPVRQSGFVDDLVRAQGRLRRSLTHTPPVHAGRPECRLAGRIQLSHNRTRTLQCRLAVIQSRHPQVTKSAPPGVPNSASGGTQWIGLVQVGRHGLPLRSCCWQSLRQLRPRSYSAPSSNPIPSPQPSRRLAVGSTSQPRP